MIEALLAPIMGAWSSRRPSGRPQLLGRRGAAADHGVRTDPKGAGARVGAPAAPAPGPVPPGLPVALDPDVRRWRDGTVLLGGDPGRLVRLTPVGAAAIDALAEGADAGLESAAARALARSLLDGGLAHPHPGPAPVRDVTVVVPVLDAAAALDRCLAALGDDAPVLVVDDGSRDPAAVAGVCARRGAALLRRPSNGGPSVARNDGLAATTTPYVAFLDADCLPPPGWLAGLLGHVADPSVAAVAPRVRGLGGTTLLARYAADRGPLDLGPRHAAVRPGTRVPYVPTAALLVRRSALPDPAFDPALRFGEDVDLVWRLHDAGWRVRYDPRTVVGHEEPTTWRAWLARRHRYGTSAAPLAQRHRGRLTPLVLPPWPTAAWLLLLARRPVLALAAAAVPAVRLHLRLRRAGLPGPSCAGTAVRVTVRAVLSTAAGLGGAGAVLTVPVLLALLAVRRTRPAAAAALLAPPLLDRVARRPAVDPVRWTALRLADDLAYASGVWHSCWTDRALAPLRPRTARPV